jgi:hypothetical protein
MKRTTAIFATVVLTVSVAGVALADDDTTSLSYISYLERYATVQPAGNAEALEAQINMPVLSGDRLETSRGARVEIQLADGSTLWVDEFTTVDFDALAFSRDDPAERTALYLADGSVGLEIPAAALGEGTTRVETPVGVVFLRRPGLYRLDLESGRLHAETFEGLAELPAGVGSSLLRPGEGASVGGEGAGVQKAALGGEADDFWSWVQERRHPAPAGETAQYVGANAASHTAILDNYGDWVYVPSFSTWMWHPRVSVTWVPYSYGRWYWTPVGWNWISYEPWGWYPFHYGSWYFDASIGWAWCWDWVWGPAWVHWIYTPGYVGWCPRGYYDWWYTHNYTPHAGRWARTALDFSGRVRLRDIDPRPWTMVPAGDFASAHVDRIRVDARRLLRDSPGEREGYVRSGTLITPSRSATAAENLFADRYRTATREVPALDALLGRGGATNLDSRSTLPLRRAETSDFARTPVRAPQERVAPRERPATMVERGSTVRSRNTVTVRPLAVEQRSSGGSERGGTTPRSGRAVPERSQPASPPSTSRPSPRAPASRPQGGKPSTSRPANPPPIETRPPAQSAQPPARSGGTSSRTPARSGTTATPSKPGSGRSSAVRNDRSDASLSERLLRFLGAQDSRDFVPRGRTGAASPVYRVPVTTAPRGSVAERTAPARPRVTAGAPRTSTPRSVRPTTPSTSRPGVSRSPGGTPPRASAPSRSTGRSGSSARSRPSSGRSRSSSGSGHRH